MHTDYISFRCVIIYKCIYFFFFFFFFFSCRGSISTGGVGGGGGGGGIETRLTETLMGLAVVASKN